jgi:hypothetical protein
MDTQTGLSTSTKLSLPTGIFLQFYLESTLKITLDVMTAYYDSISKNNNLRESIASINDYVSHAKIRKSTFEWNKMVQIFGRKLLIIITSPVNLPFTSARSVPNACIHTAETAENAPIKDKWTL